MFQVPSRTGYLQEEDLRDVVLSDEWRWLGPSEKAEKVVKG